MIRGIWFSFVALVLLWCLVDGTQAGYAIQYNTNISDVTIQKKPHDCDFFSAPIGNKNCYYEKEVWSPGPDDIQLPAGATLVQENPYRPRIKPRVVVGWKKVSE